MDDKAHSRSSRFLNESSKGRGFNDSILGLDGKVAEAGKVWDKGRNWTTVVLEVVCKEVVVGGREETLLTEDEDVLEIPVFVRMEWEGEAAGIDAGMGVEKSRERVEMAYWAVVGVGKVATLKAA